MPDLFKTDKELLWEWLKVKQYAKTSEVIAFGLANFSNRAERNARVLAEEGLIRRMEEQKRIRYFGNIKEEVWEVV